MKGGELWALVEMAKQAEEIERLRAELKNEKNWHKVLKPCPQALLDAVDEAYERAAQVCESLPYYDGFPSKDPRKDFAEAVRKLKSQAPTNETGNARMGGE